MPGIARDNDIWSGICCCHSDPTCVGMSGPIIMFSSDTKVNNRGAARLFDTVIGFCGHPGYIATASSKTKVNGVGIARLDDIVAGCTIGCIVTSSTDSKSD